jgi:hypothetical protein
MTVETCYARAPLVKMLIDLQSQDVPQHTLPTCWRRLVDGRCFSVFSVPIAVLYEQKRGSLRAGPPYAILVLIQTSNHREPLLRISVNATSGD